MTESEALEKFRANLEDGKGFFHWKYEGNCVWTRTPNLEKAVNEDMRAAMASEPTMRVHVCDIVGIQTVVEDKVGHRVSEFTGYIVDDVCAKCKKEIE